MILSPTSPTVVKDVNLPPVPFETSKKGKADATFCRLMWQRNLLEDDVLCNIFMFQVDGTVRHLYDCMEAAIQSYKLFYTKEAMLLEVSKHFEEGAKKYGEYNWQKGIPTRCYIDSAVRHYLKFVRGETDEPHDRAFFWNIMCCIWTCTHKPELNDYEKRADNEINNREDGT